MAIMSPDMIEQHPRATAGEIRIFNLLRKALPDTYYVFYDLMVSDQHPDFIIIGPDTGLTIIEAKDWSVDFIINANAEYFEIRAVKKNVRNPLNQACDYARAVTSFLQKELTREKHNRYYKGSLHFNWGYGVAFPNILVSEWNNQPFKAVIDRKYCLFKDDLDKAIGKARTGYFTLIFRGMIPSTNNQLQLKQEEVELIKSLLLREKKTVPKPKDTVPEYPDPIPQPHPQPPPPKRESKSRIAYVIGAIVIAALLWGYNLDLSSKAKKEREIQPTPTPTIPTPAPPPIEILKPIPSPQVSQEHKKETDRVIRVTTAGEILSTRTKYDGKIIKVEGVVKSLAFKVARRGNTYTSFKLADQSGRTINAFSYGHHPITEGDRVTITGKYRAKKEVAGRTFYNEIEFSDVGAVATVK